MTSLYEWEQEKFNWEFGCAGGFLVDILPLSFWVAGGGGLV